MNVSPASPSAHRSQRPQPLHLHETKAPDAQGPIRLDDVLWNPVNAEEALEGLEKILARLNARNDSRAIFLDIYAIVTRKVVHLLSREDAGGFLEPEWLSHLTGRFAEEALIAVRDSLKNLPLPTAAWRFATHYPAQRLTQPYQDALLGVSAHINHDLGMVVYDNIAQSRRALEIDGHPRSSARASRSAWTCSRSATSARPRGCSCACRSAARWWSGR